MLSIIASFRIFVNPSSVNQAESLDFGGVGIVSRCCVGIGNQVYIVECDNEKYVLRCSKDKNAYADTIHWLTELAPLDIMVPRVLFYGKYGEYHYLILNYLEGKDIGLVYPDLTKQEKKQIAKEVMETQRKVSRLQPDHIHAAWSWYDYLNEMLDRAEMRITQNGYFDSGNVKRLKKQIRHLDAYFSGIRPVAYLDDISTKNLLVHNGRFSGIIDIDWMGAGDDLTFIAMTYVALLNMGYETDYVEYLLEERGCSDLERSVFLFYSLLFTVDFMGERGMQFGDKKIEVNEEVVHTLNRIYGCLWKKWCDRTRRTS